MSAQATRAVIFPKTLRSSSCSYHLQIQCGLDPNFWQDRPEIHDPRLNAWLESKRTKAKSNQSSILLAMIPSGKNAFRLQPVSASAQTGKKPGAGPIGLELIG